MPDIRQVIELQDNAVQCFANAVMESWDHLVANFEIAEFDGVPTRNTIAIAFSYENGQWRRISFIAPYDCCNYLAQLSKAMAKEGGITWGSCTLEVDSTDRYRYSFSYEPPKRLNGVFDDEALLTNYVPHPL
jgi:hypothetical protein